MYTVMLPSPSALILISYNADEVGVSVIGRKLRLATTVKNPRRDKSCLGHLTLELTTSATGEIAPVLFINQANELNVLTPDIEDSTIEVQDSVTDTGFIDKSLFEEYIRQFVIWINGTCASRRS